MARSLIESIQGDLGMKQTAKASEGTQGASRLLRSKLTGKSTGSTAPTTTSDATVAATQQTQAGLNSVQQQGQVAASQIAGQDAQQQLRDQQAMTQADIDRQAIEQSFDIEQENLIRELSRSDRTLDNQRTIANLEQLGFMAALSDKQYIEKLQNYGRMNRFDDDLTFREGLQTQVFADSEDLFRGDLDFRSLLKADSREFAEMMAGININHALDIADHTASTASTRQVIGGVGSSVSAGVSAYGKYADKTESADDDDK